MLAIYFTLKIGGLRNQQREWLRLNLIFCVCRFRSHTHTHTHATYVFRSHLRHNDERARGQRALVWLSHNVSALRVVEIRRRIAASWDQILRYAISRLLDHNPTCDITYWNITRIAQDNDLAYVSRVCQEFVLQNFFLEKKLVFTRYFQMKHFSIEKSSEYPLLLFSVRRLVRESRKRAKVGRQLLMCACVCVYISIITKFGVHESVKLFTRRQDCTEKSRGGERPNNRRHSPWSDSQQHPVQDLLRFCICMRSYFHEATRS